MIKPVFFSLKELFVCLGLGFVSRDALGAGDVYAPALRVRSSPENANGTPSAVHQDCAREGLGEGGGGGTTLFHHRVRDTLARVTLYLRIIPTLGLP